MRLSALLRFGTSLMPSHGCVRSVHVECSCALRLRRPSPPPRLVPVRRLRNPTPVSASESEYESDDEDEDDISSSDSSEDTELGTETAEEEETSAPKAKRQNRRRADFEYTDGVESKGDLSILVIGSRFADLDDLIKRANAVAKNLSPAFAFVARGRGDSAMVMGIGCNGMPRA